MYQESRPCISEIEACFEDPESSSCIIVLVHIPPGEQASSRQPRRDVRTPSPSSQPPEPMSSTQPEGPYGMEFLTYLAYLIRTEHYGTRIVPVAVLSGQSTSANLKQKPTMTDAKLHGFRPSLSGSARPPQATYFEAGAVDVIVSPFPAERVQRLPAHAHRLNLERDPRRSSAYLPGHERKTSWVGTGEHKPYTHLKDRMVSELMDHIVNPDRQELPVDTR